MSVALFDLTPEARINLTKMALIYEEARRTRLKLADPLSLIDLINSSLETVNQDYLRYLTNFVRHLTQSELKQLASDGAKIYRGALVPEQTAAPAIPGATPVIYRGVRIDAEPAPAPAMQESGVSVEASGSRRVYRGVVLDD